jgi:Anti-sigma-K factor rskA, C-terminal
VTPSDDDRIAYLAGEPAESLSAADRAELDELLALLESPAAWDEPDPALEDRIVSAIAEAGGARESAAASRPRVRRSLASLFRRPAVAFGSLAAVAAAVAVIVIALSSTSQRQPLHFAMIVRGTPLAPGARGDATLTKTDSGWRIELHATGLAHLDNGRYYQAWVKNAAGILVPVGTFNDARSVTLWSGVPITKFRTLTVTLQQANGNPASSGRRVLLGTITPAR